MSVLLMALLIRKWWDVTQNSPQKFSSDPWAVITAYNSTCHSSTHTKIHIQFMETFYILNVFYYKKTNIIVVVGIIIIIYNKSPSLLKLEDWTWSLGICCYSLCQTSHQRRVMLPWKGTISPSNYLWRQSQMVSIFITDVLFPLQTT